MEQAFEVNFDSIVGQTHNYSGLSYGNVASLLNQQSASNPREAALQGLEKMFFLHKLGLKQAVLPPQERPHLPTLRSLGYSGTDAEIIAKAFKEAPGLLLACGSAASMWAANAATTAPSCDTEDGRVHITPANLTTKFHRSIEYPTTSKAMKKILAGPRFNHHSVLPPGSYFSDEGAANHTRLCRSYGEPGIHLFAFGRYAFQFTEHAPKIFPARQTREASQAIARLHGLKPERVIFAQQNPMAIDAGVFHNDVISVGNGNVFLYHESAFIDTPRVVDDIKQKAADHCSADIIFIKVPASRISLKEAVESYLFNSQIVTLTDGTMRMIAPSECQEMAKVKAFLDEMIANQDIPIQNVDYLNLHQSMKNGGGPACLRLRIVLNKEEIEACNPHVFMNEHLYATLAAWVKKHYRDRMLPEDLADPMLHEEVMQALDDLTRILHLDGLY